MQHGHAFGNALRATVAPVVSAMIRRLLALAGIQESHDPGGYARGGPVTPDYLYVAITHEHAVIMPAGSRSEGYGICSERERQRT
jgi:hypothetical protein